jgi:hypothetical protein
MNLKNRLRRFERNSFAAAGPDGMCLKCSGFVQVRTIERRESDPPAPEEAGEGPVECCGHPGVKLLVVIRPDERANVEEAVAAAKQAWAVVNAGTGDQTQTPHHFIETGAMFRFPAPWTPVSAICRRNLTFCASDVMVSLVSDRSFRTPPKRSGRPIPSA